MANSFHNSLHLDDNLVRQFEQNNKTQEDFIYAIFLQHKALTKSDLVMVFQKINKPIAEVSISRSLTNLQTEGKIEKTDKKIMGIYGVPNSIYRLVVGEEIEKEVEHRLKVTENEIHVLQLMFEHFRRDAVEDDYTEIFWLRYNAILQKLNKINL